MVKENEGRPTRFRIEKMHRFQIANGSWESILVGLKSIYPENVFGVADSDHWEKLEEKAAMNLKEACFQYYLAGIGHVTLARRVINSNPEIKTRIGLGDMSVGERDELVDRLSNYLYENYPERYKKKIEK